MTPRADHARIIAASCGNPLPNNTIIAALVGWSMRETGGTPRPLNNMLACGQKEPGSFTYPKNGIVQGYPSMSVEGSAVSDNLSDNIAGYADLKRAIASGNWDASVQAGLASWTGNPNGYASQWSTFVADGSQHLQDDYDIGVDTNGIVTNNINTTTNGDPWAIIAAFLVTLVKPITDFGTIQKALAAIASNPIRLVKYLVGLSVLGVGLLMIFVDVIEMVQNSQPYQALSKTGGAIKSGISKVAEVAA